MFGRTALASRLERKRKMLATGGLVVWNPIAAWLQRYGCEVLCKLQRTG